MISSEESVNDFTKGGMNIPKPPKPGEVIMCQYCGMPMLPKDFSENKIIRKREFKWHIHDKCFQQMNDVADRGVPGLLAERRKMEKRREEDRKRREL